jgi:hypothetical protein
MNERLCVAKILKKATLRFVWKGETHPLPISMARTTYSMFGMMRRTHNSDRAGVTLKAIRDQLKKWLEKVGKIVKKEATDDALLGGINISTFDKHGILGLFVNIDNASYLKDKGEKAMRKAVFVGKLFETNGSVVPDNKRYQVLKKIWVEIDSDSSESGDDENENA